MEEKKYKRVVPNSNSRMDNFFGSDKDTMIKEKYPDKKEPRRVIPNRNSNFRHFKNEVDWRGISNFYNQISGYEEVLKSFEEDCKDGIKKNMSVLSVQGGNVGIVGKVDLKPMVESALHAGLHLHLQNSGNGLGNLIESRFPLRFGCRSWNHPGFPLENRIGNPSMCAVISHTARRNIP